MRIIILLFSVLLLTGVSSDAQGQGGVYTEEDSVQLEADTTITYKEVVYKASPDSSAVVKKSFSQKTYDELKRDPELNYEQPPMVAESMWNRFLAWLAKILDAIFTNAVETNWGRMLVYLIALTILVVLVMMVLRVNAFKILYSKESQAQKYNVLDENIHEMDFERLIQDSNLQRDYRRAVRLIFLYALKLLSDKDLIHFQNGKTNHDYVAELSEKELKTGFNELSFYFEYAWYGNFNVNFETFQKVQNTFQDWRTKLRQ